MLIPPLGSILDIFEFENIWWRKTPRTNILKGLLRHIYIEKGQIKCFNFSFLGWGLKVTYNLDIFEKLRPPPWGFKCPNLNFRLFCFFLWPPPPFFGKKSAIFPFFNYDASPKTIISKYERDRIETLLWRIWFKHAVELWTNCSKREVTIKAAVFLICMVIFAVFIE